MAKPTSTMLNSVNAEWLTVSGPMGDKLHIAFVDHQCERYTLLRDEDETVLVYDHTEWSAFIDGVQNGEFD